MWPSPQVVTAVAQAPPQTTDVTSVFCVKKSYKGEQYKNCLVGNIPL